MTMPPPPSQPPGPPPQQPPGGFGQPSGGGGFGPPGSGGFGPSAPGEWPPPPPPPPRSRGKLVAASVSAAVLVLALVIGGVVFLTGGDGGSDKGAGAGPGGPGSSQTSTPSQEESGPAEDPGDDGSGTDFPTPDPDDDLPSGEPSGGTSDLALPSFMLKTGDCYDRSDKGKGTVETRDCDSAHDAEVVSRKKITGDYGSDDAVRRKADSLCRDTLKNKARQQPRGTVGGSLISYPKARGISAGIHDVTCSLTAPKGRKLHKPLA